MLPLDALKPHFSGSYAEARKKFLDRTKELDLSVRPYINPNIGPDGGELATDVAYFGPADAKKLFVMVSSTHGVEGFCGSACQLDFLAEHSVSDLPADTAILLVHAINPHGFAWQRRVTEEGCDLNRNFLDFEAPLPENPGHDELVDCFVPPALDDATLAAAEEKIAAYRAKHGEKAFQSARKAGQYKHAHSMFFGGFGPSWARQTLQKVMEDYDLPGRDFVAVVDYHTGLGPFGYGEPICGHRPDTLGVKMVRGMYGQSVGEPDLGTSSSIPLHGTARDLWDKVMGDKYSYVALEYGTYDVDRGRKALRGDHWLHNQGEFDWNDPVAAKIKAAIRKQYYPEYDDWKEAVLWRSRQIQHQTLTGLKDFSGV